MVADASTRRTSTPQLLTGLSRELVGDLRAYFADHRARVERVPHGERNGSEVALAYAKLYDGVLSALFSACHAAMSQRGQWTPLALASVGSYGRRLLSPFSDLDVRLLCAGDPAQAAPAAEALLYPLWDAGLSIGHQVVSGDELLELATRDVTTATALLDWRPIAGDMALGAELLERAYATLFDPEHIGDFVDALEARARARHQRFGDSVYLLEPDVKNGAGGLRDLDIAHWCARARYRVADLSQLVHLNVLLQREWAEVEQARNRLLEIRHALHLCAGRRTDRLTFDLQERVTERIVPGGGYPATERLMSEYYRAARVITRLADTLLTRARPARPRHRSVPIGGGLVLRDDCVGLEHSSSLQSEPALALRVYDEAVSRELPVCEHTRQALARVAGSPEFGAALRASPVASELFLKLLGVVQRTRLPQGSVLRDLHDVGLLVAMIPEFAPLVGRVHRDTYHVYTVDVHSVAAVDHVRAMCRGELALTHPLASRLAGELPRRQVLLLAALLHDVGKAYGGEGHTERGVEMARGILERLGVAPADSDEIRALIGQHLSMYEVSTRRDLEDPHTLAEFCAHVKERQMLRELYLLTIADVTTTNPTSMTNWKRRMLDALFVAADRVLAGEPSRVSPRTAGVRSRVLALWGELDRVFIEHFVSGLPERYFYANDPDAILEHALFARGAQSRVASIRQAAVSHPYFELWVVADDRPGLLAMITATLSHSKLKVRSAQVYSWIGQDGRSRSLDIFWVRGPEDQERAVRLLPRLARDLEKAIEHPVPPEELERLALSGTRSSVARRAQLPTEVNVDNESASNYTVIEVITRDRPGLLFVLSHALQQLGLSIWFAKINTEGDRVIDVFYVSDAARKKLVISAEIGRVRSAIVGAVERLDARSATGLAKCVPPASLPPPAPVS
ncbi:MAG TPA: [protein-PII] uridylyltransferase [Polyangiaceae bacterium]|nr:[protein-PII] uridylyltransferase [Polyangiaceae bacterium]